MHAVRRAMKTGDDSRASNIEIRSAVPGDMEPVCDLYCELHAFDVQDVPDRSPGLEASNSEEQREVANRDAAVVRVGDSIILVAVPGPTVVALAEVHLRADEPIAAGVRRRFSHLQSLVVEDVRDRGMGGALLTGGTNAGRVLVVQPR